MSELILSEEQFQKSIEYNKMMQQKFVNTLELHCNQSRMEFHKNFISNINLWKNNWFEAFQKIDYSDLFNDNEFLEILRKFDIYVNETPENKNIINHIYFDNNKERLTINGFGKLFVKDCYKLIIHDDLISYVENCQEVKVFDTGRATCIKCEKVKAFKRSFVKCVDCQQISALYDSIVDIDITDESIYTTVKIFNSAIIRVKKSILPNLIIAENDLQRVIVIE